MVDPNSWDPIWRKKTVQGKACQLNASEDNMISTPDRFGLCNVCKMLDLPAVLQSCSWDAQGSKYYQQTGMQCVLGATAQIRRKAGKCALCRLISLIIPCSFGLHHINSKSLVNLRLFMRDKLAKVGVSVGGIGKDDIVTPFRVEFELPDAPTERFPPKVGFEVFSTYV